MQNYESSMDEMTVFGESAAGFEQRIKSLGDCVSYQNNALIIDADEEKQDELLQAIRRDELLYFMPVFCLKSSRYTESLSDGMVGDISVKRPLIIERWSNIPLHENADLLDKLAWFIWSRADFKLIPLWSTENEEGYSYPLLDALTGQTAKTVLNQLVEDEILEIDSLTDRVRLCNKCHSKHVNYIEGCPECSSIDIRLTSGIHCFVCGHVDDQDKFQLNGRLKCPKCTTQLRHIGVDYDRPLERFNCNSCHSRFIEASVQCRCHNCHHVQTPEELIVVPVYTYRPGKMARHVALQGAKMLSIPLTWGNMVSAEHLPWLLQWNNTLLLRHGGFHTLMAIHLDNLSTIKFSLGLIELKDKINELTSNLKQIFRETDVVCQYEDDLLIVMLPYTNSDVWSVIRQRILELTNVPGLENISLEVHVESLPIKEFGSADEWLISWLSKVLNDE